MIKFFIWHFYYKPTLVKVLKDCSVSFRNQVFSNHASKQATPDWLIEKIYDLYIENGWTNNVTIRYYRDRKKEIQSG